MFVIAMHLSTQFIKVSKGYQNFFRGTSRKLFGTLSILIKFAYNCENIHYATVAHLYRPKTQFDVLCGNVNRNVALAVDFSSFFKNKFKAIRAQHNWRTLFR